MTTYNTGNPIGSTDPRDLYDNAQNFDVGVNDRTNQTWTDRLGVARKTVWGAFSDITYKTPVAYAVGLNFLTTDANKTVEEAGVVYAPLNSALPFTASGTFAGDDDARFYPVQDKNNVIRATSISEIEGLPGVSSRQVSLSGSSPGIFEFSTSDLSVKVSSDPGQNRYISPASAPSGASGAWVRLVNFPFQATGLTPVAHIHETDQPYTAWPFSALFVDSDDSSVNQCYSGGPGHLIDGGIVYTRKMTTTEDSKVWGERVEIANRESSNFIATTHGALKTPGGDYICFVRFISFASASPENWIYRSTNQGSSWSGEQLKDNSDNIIVLSTAGTALQEIGAPHGVYVTASGAILFFGYDTAASKVTMYRSTDSSGANSTWAGSDVAKPTSMNGIPLEGGFAQDPADGTIICYARRGFNGSFNQDTLVYTKSTDDGLTWSEFEYSSVTDAFDEPCAFIEYPEQNSVECFWTSRSPNAQDGLGSIYQSVASYEDLKAGKLNSPIRIGKGSPTNDFGYVAAVKNDAGDVFVNYYNGNDKWTAIVTLHGNRSGPTQVSGMINGVIAQGGDAMTGWELMANNWVKTWKSTTSSLSEAATAHIMPVPLRIDTRFPRVMCKATWEWTTNASIISACGSTWETISEGTFNLFQSDTTKSSAVPKVFLCAEGPITSYPT